MKDNTIIKIMAMGCLTLLAVVYFIMVRNDGAIFGTVSTAFGVIVGYEVGKDRGN